MDTLLVVLAMVGVALVLLIGAVVADRRLEHRIERRASGEEPASGKPDPADTLIELLDRTRGMVRQTLDAANKDDKA